MAIHVFNYEIKVPERGIFKLYELEGLINGKGGYYSRSIPISCSIPELTEDHFTWLGEVQAAIRPAIKLTGTGTDELLSISMRLSKLDESITEIFKNTRSK